jgi:predicted alpha/beta superfamily hydrolase
LIVAALMALALGGQAGATERASPLAPPPQASVTPVVPAQIPLASQFDIKSNITGRTYRIYFTRPLAPAPASGYAVLYVLDADATFATAASQAMLASTLNGLKPLIVVGIGYPDALSALKLRNWDLTPSKANANTLSKEAGAADDYGGGDAFYRFMVEELQPTIDRFAKVDSSQQSLMGYSLGGLFAAHILLTHPEAYRNFVIGSPAFFWNDREVFKDVPRFARRVSSGEISPRILITSSELEQSDASGLSTLHLIDYARQFADQLKSIQGSSGYAVSYDVLSGESHNAGLAASTSRGVSFVVSH